MPHPFAHIPKGEDFYSLLVRHPVSCPRLGALTWVRNNEASRTLYRLWDARLGQYLPPFLSDSGVVAKTAPKKTTRRLQELLRLQRREIAKTWVRSGTDGGLRDDRCRFPVAVSERTGLQ